VSNVDWTRRVIAKLVSDYLSQMSPLVSDPPETEAAKVFLDVCQILELTDEDAGELGVAAEIEASRRAKLANLPEYWVDVRKALDE
jgi:hypothetical protein